MRKSDLILRIRQLYLELYNEKMKNGSAEPGDVVDIIISGKSHARMIGKEYKSKRGKNDTIPE